LLHLLKRFAFFGQNERRIGPKNPKSAVFAAVASELVEASLRATSRPLPESLPCRMTVTVAAA
jgi:hypothetical protein